MDDDVGLDVLEDGLDLFRVGDVGFVVGGGWVAVVRAAEVDYGDGAGLPAVASQELVDDVVAQEAIAADDEDLAQVDWHGSLFGRHLFWGRFVSGGTLELTCVQVRAKVGRGRWCRESSVGGLVSLVPEVSWE